LVWVEPQPPISESQKRNREDYSITRAAYIECFHGDVGFAVPACSVFVTVPRSGKWLQLEERGGDCGSNGSDGPVYPLIRTADVIARDSGTFRFHSSLSNDGLLSRRTSSLFHLRSIERVLALKPACQVGQAVLYHQTYVCELRSGLNRLQ
jgi:hypothetical protein